VKRTFGILAGVAALSIAGYFGGWTWAQITQPAQEITPPGVKTGNGPLRTRIAVINMVKVLKNYKKFEWFDNQYKEQQKKWAKPLEEKRGKLIAADAEMKKTADATRKADLEQQIKVLQREMQDMDEEARKALTKLNGEMMVLIYKEVEDQVREYARRYEIDMVLHYNDALTDSDYHSSLNVQRKVVNFASLMPMYFDSRMDISDGVAYFLNEKYKATQPITPASGRQ